MFNIRGKYDYMMASQLFLQGDFSLLTFQEPAMSHNNNSKSWQAFKRKEMNSARIVAFETHHQILLYDSLKWGGKIFEEYSSFINGRILSISFEFEKGQQIGFISIYSYTQSNCPAIEKDREALTIAVQELTKKWKASYTNIQIIILGDFNETSSIGTDNNIGNARIRSPPHGLLKTFQSSHTSIIRNRILQQGSTYVTEFGEQGGRGIDHVLVPQGSSNNLTITNCIIDRKADMGLTTAK